MHVLARVILMWRMARIARTLRTFQILQAMGDTQARELMRRL